MGTLTFALLYKGVQRTIEQRTIEILCMIFLCTFQSHIVQFVLNVEKISGAKHSYCVKQCEIFVFNYVCQYSVLFGSSLKIFNMKICQKKVGEKLLINK